MNSKPIKLLIALHLACGVLSCPESGVTEVLAQTKQRQLGSIPEEFEQRLADWTRDETTAPPEILKLLDRSIGVEGKWQAEKGYSSVLLTLKKNKEGGFSATFEMRGCLASWEMRTPAKHNAGIIYLDQPVIEYDNSAYDTLYVISVEGRNLLLSKAEIPIFLQARAMVVADTEKWEDQDSKNQAKQIPFKNFCFYRVTDKE